MFANKIGWLLQGFRTSISSGTNTILFIPKRKVPAGSKVAYGITVEEIWPLKAEKHSTWLTLGVNLINFSVNVTKPTADLIEAKLIFNSVLQKECKIHVRINLQILFEQSHGQIWVYETTTGHYPRLNHPKMQSQKLVTQRFCIYVNPKGGVWTNPSKKYLKW